MRIDDFDGEFFGANVAEAHGGIALFDGVPDGVHQVSLAHAHSAVEEQRVVGFGGLLGDGAGSGMGELIGFADDEAVEGVAEVQLMVAAFEIELGLLDAGHDRGGGQGLVFTAEIVDLYVGSADLVEDGFNDLAVGTGQNLAKNGAGNLHVEALALGTIEAGRLKPGIESVDADPGLHAVKKFIPGINGYGHRVENTKPVLFPQM